MTKTFTYYANPLLIVCKLLGLLQCRLQTKANLFLFALSAILQAFFAFCLVKTLLSSDNWPKTSPYYLSASAVNLTGKFVWYFQKKDAFREVLEEIDEFGEKRRKRNLRVGLYILLVVLIEAIFALNDHYCVTNFLKIDLYHYWLYAMGYYVGMFEYLMIAEMANVLRNSFACINHSLKTKINTADFDRIAPAKDAITAKKLEIESTVDRVVVLVNKHYLLINLAEKIEGLFSIPTLLVSAADFVVITISLYNIITTYKHMNDIEGSAFLLASAISWFVLVAFHVALLIKTWTATTEEANKTATYIHDIWNKYAIRGEADSKIHHLQLVSVQLLNTRLHFTAHGFFPLDWSLLHMIVGAVTTYVVVLIQFEG